MSEKSETLQHDGVPGANVATSAPPRDASAAVTATGTDNSARLQLWLIVAGFAMMFLASLLMWVRFGPSMFVDLATAVANCF